MGLAPGARTAYPHRADPALVEACRQGLLQAGKIEGFGGPLELY